MDISGVYYCSKCMLEIAEEGVCPHCGYDSASVERSREHLEEGTFLNGRYLLGAVIGSGGFGITYAAWDTLLEAPVAIKEYFPGDFVERDVRDSDDVVLRPKYETEYKLGLRRFIQESRVLAMFRQVPGIVNVSDCFEENETFYFVMEYVRGVSLDEYVKAHKVDAKRLLEMMRSIIDALEVIHNNGILHRDITPKNLMVLDDGSVKLIDFGSARKIDREGTSIIVTEHYAPVEQYDNMRSQGPWTDIYSLCATMYEMITGVVPQESLLRKYHDEVKAPSKMNIRLKKYQERALMAGMAIEPEKRIRNMAELRYKLYNLLAPEEVRMRRAFLRKVYTCVACAAILAAIAIVNFVFGLPLGRGLLYALYPDGFHVTGAIADVVNLEIPARRLGIPVTQVDASAFLECKTLTELVLPGSVKTVEETAFLGCDNLKMVTLNEGVETIDSRAFASCPNLHTAYMPSSAEYISNNAFDGAWERFAVWGEVGSAAAAYAEENDIPYMIKEHFSYTLSDGCAVLEWDWMEATQTYHNEGKIYPGDGDAITGLYKEFVLPSYIDGYRVTSLSENFNGPSANRLVLPYYLEYIPEGRVLASPALSEVDLGQHLKAIPMEAFCETNLTSVDIPDTVESIGDWAFADTPLCSVSLPANLKYIGNQAFQYTRLNDISLPEGLVSIGDYAFADTSIYEVEIPSSVEKIGISAFSGTNLKAALMRINTDILSEYTFAYNWQLDTVYIIAEEGDADAPSSGIIPNYCFAGSGVGTVSMLGAVKEIGEYCFAASEVYQVSLPEGLESINKGAFAECTNLQSIIIPDSVSYISSTAFYNCPEDMQIIGSPDSYAEGYAAYHGICFVPGLDILKEDSGYNSWEVEYISLINYMHEEYGDSALDKYGVPDFDILLELYEKHGYYDPEVEDIQGMDIFLFECGPLVLDAYDMYFSMPIKQLQADADAGDADAMYLLGLCYYYGSDVEQSEEEASRWVSLAAESGNADAQRRMKKWNQ